ncbi:hypothetical protein TNCV_2584651 [Trichonephila clavipes]|nr:hypothetical protein TNCV_2584651 [Trichonephila clavipes]
MRVQKLSSLSQRLDLYLKEYLWEDLENRLRSWSIRPFLTTGTHYNCDGRLEVSSSDQLLQTGGKSLQKCSLCH